MRILSRHRATLTLLLLCVSIASCAPSTRAFVGAETQVDDRLYFGRTIPGGERVSSSGWRDFLRDVVVPKFPNGLTTWQADGRWRDSTGTVVTEKTFVLELIHPDSERDDMAIAAIIEQYKMLFHQESVMRVKSLARVGF